MTVQYGRRPLRKLTEEERGQIGIGEKYFVDMRADSFQKVGVFPLWGPEEDFVEATVIKNRSADCVEMKWRKSAATQHVSIDLLYTEAIEMCFVHGEKMFHDRRGEWVCPYCDL